MIHPPTPRFLALIWLTTVSVGVQDARAQAADREQILHSAEWRKTMSDLDEWYSVQKIYDKDEVAKLKGELEKKVAGMSAEQLTDFLGDLKRKVAVLNSDEARDARKWLDETLAVAAPAYAQKVLAKLPDVAHLTAAQLQEQLDKFEDEQAAKRKYSSDFAKLRQQQTQQVREDSIRAGQERARITAAAAAAPRSNYNFTVPRRNVVPGYLRSGVRYPVLYGGYRW